MATVYLFKWAAWNFHSSCKWADFVAVQMGHKIKEKELKPRFHMLGNSYTIGDFTFCRLSQTLPIYWILSTRLSLILPILNLAGNGKCVKNWNLRDRGTEAQIFRGLVKSEIHCRRPRRYKFEFSFIGNDRQPSQKSWRHLENVWDGQGQIWRIGSVSERRSRFSRFVPDHPKRPGISMSRVFISRQNLGRSGWNSQ